MISDLLTGNGRFVKDEFTPHREYYESIAMSQHPRVLWIGCSDSRVSEDVITGSRPGTLFVHRNVANIVSFNDVNVAALIEYAVAHLKIPDIVICGHTRCGGIQAIEDGVGESYISDWLLIAQGAKDQIDQMAREQHLSREQKLDLLARENVKLQIKHLRCLSFIRRRVRDASAPRIHGWLYAVETGHIEVLVDGLSTETSSEPMRSA